MTILILTFTHLIAFLVGGLLVLAHYEKKRGE